MNKILAAIIYFALTSCGNQKAEQAGMNQSALPDDSISVQSTVPIKTEYTTKFSANAVTETGKSINCIFQDMNNNYWFATNGQGVYCYDGVMLIQFTAKDGLCDNQVFTIQEDKRGNIWFLTAGGISRFDAARNDSAGQGKIFTTFPGKDNKQLISDKDLKMETDDLWFETGGGAYRCNGNSFSYLLLPESDSDSKHFNPTNPRKPDSRKLNAYSVYCSLKDKKGNLWFGTQTLGVCRYDGKTFTWFTEKGLSGPAVRALFEDRDGNLWFGNNGNGLFRFDARLPYGQGKILTNFTEEKGLGNPEFLKTGKSAQGNLARVWTINEDNQGNIWIGTYDSGVWRYDARLPDGQGKNLTNYTTKDGLSGNAVNTIYKDKKGELWFGTDGAGVCKFNGTSFSVFTIAH